MSQGTVRTSTLSLAGAYFFLATLFLWPLVDLLSNAWPIQLGNIQWRYGFMGLLTAYLHTPLLALGLGLVLAFALRNWITLRVVSAVCVLGAVFLFLVMGLFALDGIQLRGSVPAENLGPFQAGMVLSELKFLTALITALLLGWGGWRTAGKAPAKARSKGASDLTAEVMKAQKRD